VRDEHHGIVSGNERTQLYDALLKRYLALGKTADLTGIVEQAVGEPQIEVAFVGPREGAQQHGGVSEHRLTINPAVPGKALQQRFHQKTGAKLTKDMLGPFSEPVKRCHCQHCGAVFTGARRDHIRRVAELGKVHEGGVLVRACPARPKVRCIDAIVDALVVLGVRFITQSSPP